MKTGIFILNLFFTSLCFAQSDSIIKPEHLHFNLTFSCNGSLIYPGMSVGFEFPFKLSEIRKLRKISDFKYFTKGRYLSGNANWYHHPDFHDNIYLTAEWIMRRTNSKGLISEFSFGPGFSRTFLGGTTYRVNDRGDVNVVRLAGYNYALISIGGGLGIDFYVKRQKPYSIITKMNLISMFPYNSTVYLRPVLELGINYMPWQIKSKFINNVK